MNPKEVRWSDVDWKKAFRASWGITPKTQLWVLKEFEVEGRVEKALGIKNIFFVWVGNVIHEISLKTGEISLYNGPYFQISDIRTDVDGESFIENGGSTSKLRYYPSLRQFRCPHEEPPQVIDGEKFYYRETQPYSLMKIFCNVYSLKWCAVLPNGEKIFKNSFPGGYYRGNFFHLPLIGCHYFNQIMEERLTCVNMNLCSVFELPFPGLVYLGATFWGGSTWILATDLNQNNIYLVGM